MKTEKKILIVEDESIIAIDSKDKLSDLGFEQSEVADTVEKARSLLESYQPDLILLDINLNDEIDGIELAEEIQQRKNIPIIFVTAYSDESTLKRAIAINPLGYIIKPFSMNELNTSINLAFYKHDMDRKLLESEQRYRGLFDTAQVGIVTVSGENGLVKDCNWSFQEMVGSKDKASLIGKPLSIFYKEPEDFLQVEKALQDKGCINHYESCMINASGEDVWFEGSTWINKINNLIESVFIDITDRKQIEDRLRQSQKMETVGQITAGIAHEINNPLAVITTRLQMLQDDIENTQNDSAVKQMEVINKNIYRMSGIIERLLGFSRTNEIKVQANINILLDDVLFFVTGKARKSQINIELDFQKDLPLISVFRNRIEQVFLNVIMNSFDSMPQGGSLKIMTELFKNNIRIVFHDSGSGMSEDSLKKIFEPFYTTKPMGKGTGLGMYISYGIVKEHNGEITLMSKLQEGTRMVISLPLDQE